jgi:hypothetical protein
MDVDRTRPDGAIVNDSIPSPGATPLRAKCFSAHLTMRGRLLWIVRRTISRLFFAAPASKAASAPGAPAMRTARTRTAESTMRSTPPDTVLFSSPALQELSPLAVLDMTGSVAHQVFEARRRDDPKTSALSFALLFGHALACIPIIPHSPLRHLDEPVYVAAIGDLLTLVAISGMRLIRAPLKLERLMLAIFLASMPLVYVFSCLEANGEGRDLFIELVGLAIFAGLAIAGYLRRPTLIGMGIVAHGLLWDAWHYGQPSVVPSWYALGCAIADVGVGGYALLRFRA